MVSNERLRELVNWTPGGKTVALSADRDEWQAMAAELLARREAERLRAVEEELPEVGTYNLIWRGGVSKYFKIAKLLMTEHGHEWWHGLEVLYDVTHWRPLPQPPAEEGKETR